MNPITPVNVDQIDVCHLNLHLHSTFVLLFCFSILFFFVLLILFILYFHAVIGVSWSEAPHHTSSRENSISGRIRNEILSIRTTVPHITSGLPRCPSCCGLLQANGMSPMSSTSVLLCNLYSMKSLWRMTTRSSKSSTTKRWRSEKSTRTPSADWRTPWSVSNWPKPQPLTIMKLYKPATIICVRTWTRTKRPVWPDLAPFQVLSIEYHSPLEDSVRRYETESSLFYQFLHRYSWTRQWV